MKIKNKVRWLKLHDLKADCGTPVRQWDIGVKRHLEWWTKEEIQEIYLQMHSQFKKYTKTKEYTVNDVGISEYPSLRKTKFYSQLIISIKINHRPNCDH